MWDACGDPDCRRFCVLRVCWRNVDVVVGCVGGAVQRAVERRRAADSARDRSRTGEMHVGDVGRGEVGRWRCGEGKWKHSRCRRTTPHVLLSTTVCLCLVPVSSRSLSPYLARAVPVPVSLALTLAFTLMLAVALPRSRLLGSPGRSRSLPQ
eukprot:2784084-Rhodomonas_salina.1